MKYSRCDIEHIIEKYRRQIREDILANEIRYESESLRFSLNYRINAYGTVLTKEHRNEISDKIKFSPRRAVFLESYNEAKTFSGYMFSSILGLNKECALVGNGDILYYVEDDRVVELNFIHFEEIFSDAIKLYKEIQETANEVMKHITIKYEDN